MLPIPKQRVDNVNFRPAAIDSVSNARHLGLERRAAAASATWHKRVPALPTRLCRARDRIERASWRLGFRLCCANLIAAKSATGAGNESAYTTGLRLRLTRPVGCVGEHTTNGTISLLRVFINIWRCALIERARGAATGRTRCSLPVCSGDLYVVEWNYSIYSVF